MQVVTVNASTSVTEQIRLFNNFDVLITPHGSHLANGIFSMHPGAKALIEIVPFAFDRVFYSNFVPNLGFAHYIMSTGHLTPQQEMSDGKHCLFKGSKRFSMCIVKLGFDVNVAFSQFFYLVSEFRLHCRAPRYLRPRIITMYKCVWGNHVKLALKKKTI